MSNLRSADSPAEKRTELFGRILEMQDEERRRIARLLHDTTGQNLGALRIGLSMILVNSEIDVGVRKAIEDSVALADCCIREIRDLSNLLHPPLLEELGLGSALRVLTERTGVRLELDLQMPRLPQAVELALFRIVEEGLSGTGTAILRLKHESGQVQIEFTGRSPKTSPFSIEIMRERVRKLGGLLTETATTIRVLIPAPTFAAI